MGIDFTSFEGILASLKYVMSGGKVLTLARQGIHINKDIITYMTRKYGRSFTDGVLTPYCETLLKELGFAPDVDSIDCSPYEGATIIHDMNKPIPEIMKQKYDYIYDGGTIEHVFNIAQVVDNISDMLKVGGIFCSVTVNNNFSGHGIYQFSPEFFMSAFSETYGMKVLELYLAKVNTPKEAWIDVKSLNEAGDGRNMKKFDDSEPVYIIAIVQKINDHRCSVITHSPQQYSYSQIDWLRVPN